LSYMKDANQNAPCNRPLNDQKHALCMFQVSQDIEDESLSKSVEEDEYLANLRKCYIESVEEDEYLANLRKCYVIDKNVAEYADEDGSSTGAGSNKAQ
jgi:hypothetical protein